jgi:hypothetical protein
MMMEEGCRGGYAVMRWLPAMVWGDRLDGSSREGKRRPVDVLLGLEVGHEELPGRERLQC